VRWRTFGDAARWTDLSIRGARGRAKNRACPKECCRRLGCAFSCRNEPGGTMKKGLVYVCLLSGVVAGAARADHQTLGYGPSITVLEDNGGNTFEYRRSAQSLKRFRGSIIISGSCLSSCVAYVGLPNACVTRGARLMFHQARAATEELRQAGEEAVLSTVPPRLATYWRACIVHGFDCWITGADAIAMGARECR
jgi:hypothetical protein